MSIAGLKGDLRAGAEGLAQALPPLLASADQLAATVLMGEHGRRRPGMGENFWQFRAAAPGDPLRRIDWRRSARSDQQFIRETEWQVEQSVMLWVDPSRAMEFSSQSGGPGKAHRARLLALALAVLLLRGGERVGLCEPQLPARPGRAQRERLFTALESLEAASDYGTPPVSGFAPQGRMVLFSDFLGDPAALERCLARAADLGMRGALVQVLDPVETAFPFGGRTIFESMTGGLRHETLQAAELRARYLERLAERQALLAGLSLAAGWQYHCHITSDPAAAALLWLYRALEGRGG